MNESSVDTAKPDALLDEVKRLRARVDELTAEVAALDALAHQDALTGLPNRRAFVRELDRMIARMDRHGIPAAVLFIDFDGLKALNDGFGHGCGDRALAQVAELLQMNLRRTDLAARIGGDEFAVLLDEVGDEEAEAAADRMRASIRTCPFTQDGHPVALSAAIGVAVIVRGDDIESALARADADMYARKDAA